MFDKKNIIYNKNSVYFRINTQMKLNIRQNRKYNTQKYLDNYSNDSDTHNTMAKDTDIDDDNDEICDNDNNEDIEYDEYNIDDNNDNLNELSDNADNENDMNLDGNLDDNIDMENDDNDINNDNERIYYKELLNKHGFIFNEDKDCILIFQEYIN